jgi:hypothetical protein
MVDEIIVGAVLVRNWNADAFHSQVLDFESRGYIARLDSYSITPEMNPETGEVIHLYMIEMLLPEDAQK